MRKESLRHALLIGCVLVPGALAALDLASGCADEPDVIRPPTSSGAGGGAGGTSASSSGSGGTSASSGNGGMGGMVVEDAGGSGCPSAPNTAAMVEVPGPNGDTYCMDATEVTNAHYAAWLATNPSLADQSAFCASNTSFEPAAGAPPMNDLPVASVDWCDAFAYCKGAGKRLCGRIGGGPAPYYAHDNASLNMWFNACSHGGTQDFPYGQAYDANGCNGSDAKFGTLLSVGALPSCEGGFPGIFDMSGNVWEWEDACVPQEGGVDTCRRRGGAVNSSDMLMRCGVGSSKERDYQDERTGFRCCAD